MNIWTIVENAWYYEEITVAEYDHLTRMIKKAHTAGEYSRIERLCKFLNDRAALDWRFWDGRIIPTKQLRRQYL